jgi:hypothetical protein
MSLLGKCIQIKAEGIQMVTKRTKTSISTSLNHQLYSVYSIKDAYTRESKARCTPSITAPDLTHTAENGEEEDVTFLATKNAGDMLPGSTLIS